MEGVEGPSLNVAIRSQSAGSAKGGWPWVAVGPLVGGSGVWAGYNGFPLGCSDDLLPWARDSPDGLLETKYPYVCHAEMNAILNKNIASVKGEGGRLDRQGGLSTLGLLISLSGRVWVGGRVPHVCGPLPL